MNSAEQLQVYDSQLAGNNSSRDPTPACPYPQYVLALVRICRGALALVPKVLTGQDTLQLILLVDLLFLTNATEHITILSLQLL